MFDKLITRWTSKDDYSKGFREAAWVSVVAVIGAYLLGLAATAASGSSYVGWKVFEGLVLLIGAAMYYWA